MPMISNYSTRTILRKWYKILILIVGMINLYSYNIINAASKKTINSDIIITSDSLNVDNNNFTANFKGKVTVLFDDIILKTDYLKIYYTDNNSKKSITKIEIPGNLKAIKKLNNEVVIANSGEYIVASQKLTLKGEVKARKDKYVLVTDKMVYFTKFQLITKQNNEK
jgi:lipopolysaccharide transport protein LptA